MPETKVLMDCGLTKTESKIYLELLKLGPSTAYKIAKDASVHKANGYAALRNLVDKGLVSSIVKNNSTIYQTTDPNNIKLLLRRKEDRVNAILPKLKLIEGLAVEKSEAAVLKGIPTFMNLLHGLLEYKKPILVYGIPKVAPEALKYYIMDFHKEREKIQVPMHHIYNFDASERIKTLKKVPYTKARSLPKSVESTASTLICGPEVHIQVWSENSVKIIRIKDEDIAKSYKSYFDFLWKLAN